MKIAGSIKVRGQRKISLDYRFLMLIAACMLLFGPFMGISSMYGMVGDTAIQIKIGMDGIESGHLMLDEIYSWHENLTWTAHEEGWYFLVGAMYHLFGLAGVILTGTIFNYGTAFLILSKTGKEANPLIVAGVMVIIPFLNGFPDYNVRPSAASAFFITLLIVTTLRGMSARKRDIIFVLSAYILAWLHGGILPIFFAVYALLGIIEILFKNFRGALCHLAVMAVTFALTLLNPIGIGIYSFGLKQMGATDIWQYVQEWQRTEFSIPQLLLILILFIGFMVSGKVRTFEKQALTELGLVCMFFGMAVIYTRFLLYFSIIFFLCAPRLVSEILGWLNENIFRFKTGKKALSDAFYGLVAVICVVFMVFSGVMNATRYLKTNSMADIESMAAYDGGVIDFIKDKGYVRIYNSFNTGSWLAFYDIPVHIDNRIDPYMREYSGVDHIRGRMYMGSVADLDSFRAEYDNDAFLIDIQPGSDSLIRAVTEEASDRYRIVYDNTVVSNLTDTISTRWIVIECI